LLEITHSNVLDKSEKDIASDCSAFLKAAAESLATTVTNLKCFGGTRREERKRKKAKKAA